MRVIVERGTPTLSASHAEFCWSWSRTCWRRTLMGTIELSLCAFIWVAMMPQAVATDQAGSGCQSCCQGNDIGPSRAAGDDLPVDRQSPPWSGAGSLRACARPPSMDALPALRPLVGAH